MKFKDYQSAVLNDALEAINDGEYEDYESFDSVYYDMFIDDSITGNASGSYTFNRYQAEENTKDLFWDDDFKYELKGLGYETIPCDDPEALDVIARCVALSYVSGDIEEAWNERNNHC